MTARFWLTDVSTLDARRQAYSQFLATGVVRVGIGLPVLSDFTVTIEDPSAAAIFAQGGKLSLFRRPLANTNMGLDSAVNWDARSSIRDLRTQAQKTAVNLLLAQANQFGPGKAITDLQAQQIADFETHVFTAQVFDNAAGSLIDDRANGGPDFLSRQRFRLNTLPPTANTTMTLFNAWNVASGDRGSVARGQDLFNTKTCIECHNVRNVGNDTAQDFLRFGHFDEDAPGGLSLLADDFTTRLALPKFADRIRQLPVYCLRPKASTSTLPCGQDGADVRLTDPAWALITGRLLDAGRFKPPILRGLAARAPYFHNGAAETLGDVVDFYNVTLRLTLTTQEHNDLVAFLRSL